MILEKEWAEFAEACMAKDCGEDQVRDMRIAFISGAAMLLCRMRNTHYDMWAECRDHLAAVSVSGEDEAAKQDDGATH